MDNLKRLSIYHFQETNQNEQSNAITKRTVKFVQFSLHCLKVLHLL